MGKRNMPTIIITTYILNRGKNRYFEMFASMPSSLHTFYLNMSISLGSKYYCQAEINIILTVNTLLHQLGN